MPRKVTCLHNSMFITITGAVLWNEIHGIGSSLVPTPSPVPSLGTRLPTPFCPLLGTMTWFSCHKNIPASFLSIIGLLTSNPTVSCSQTAWTYCLRCSTPSRWSSTPVWQPVGRRAGRRTRLASRSSRQSLARPSPPALQKSSSCFPSHRRPSVSSQ